MCQITFYTQHTYNGILVLLLLLIYWYGMPPNNGSRQVFALIELRGSSNVFIVAAAAAIVVLSSQVNQYLSIIVLICLVTHLCQDWTRNPCLTQSKMCHKCVSMRMAHQFFIIFFWAPSEFLPTRKYNKLRLDFVKFGIETNHLQIKWKLTSKICLKFTSSKNRLHN